MTNSRARSSAAQFPPIASVPHAVGHRARSANRFRSDIQGLRAIAVVAVVAYHSGVAGLSGGYAGVDVFFVISGFLITTHLAGSIKDRSLRLRHFYARRVRRLMPASITVLLVSVVLGYLVTAPLDRQGVLQDAAATALYMPNILFAVQGTDYLAGNAPSLFQHYWSLGLEEQFYLLWPILLLLVAKFAGRSPRTLLIAVALVTLSSFAIGVWMTEWRQPFAFFLLPSRAWEFGLGAIVGLAVLQWPALAKRSRLWTIAGWLACLGLVFVFLVFTSTTPFPSWHAAFPAAATALLILAGTSDSPNGPGMLLATRPLQFLGKISYSLYLVHWPILLIPQLAVGWHNPLPTWSTLTLGLASVPLAWLCWRFVEEPGRSESGWWGRSNRRALGAAMSVGAAIALVAAPLSLSPRIADVQAGPAAPTTVLNLNPVGTPHVPLNLSPTLTDTHDDVAEIYANGCHLDVTRAVAADCSYGSNTDAPVVALFGDSHAATWFPALNELATRGQIQLLVHTKSSCPSASVDVTLPTGADYPACDAWRSDVLNRLQDIDPDVIVLANFTSFYLGSSSDWEAGLTRTIEEVGDGRRVLVVGDVPEHDFDPATCLSRETRQALDCGSPLSDAVDVRAAEIDRSVAAATGASYLSIVPYLCSDTCPAIIGNTIFYRDEHHLTATSSRLFAPIFHDALDSAD